MNNRLNKKKIAVFIVAYNAVTTLASVLRRIPSRIYDLVEEIYVIDDCSADDTYLVGQGYKTVSGFSKLTMFRNERNLGYGGNQKLGFQYAIDRGYDYLVLLHGDGQYAPEALPHLLAPLDNGECDAIFGSRMLEPGAARAGGMPLYKFLGNKILSTMQNKVLGMDLSEFHSGYRVYNVHSLAKVPFHLNSDDFHFDTQIIVQFKEAGFSILELPIPTYYGEEICYVNGLNYAANVTAAVLTYRLAKLGLVHAPEYRLDWRAPEYHVKRLPHSSHGLIPTLVGHGKKVLELGCGPGHITASLLLQDNKVTAVDLMAEPPLRHKRLRYLRADLDHPEVLGLRGRFDRIVLADVLEHLRRPTDLLRLLRTHLEPTGTLIVSSGNVALLPYRVGLLFGRFDYTEKGVLDETHLRLYTERSLRELLLGAGYEILGRRVTALPFDELLGKAVLAKLADSLYHRCLAQPMPGLFAYQFVLEAKAKHTIPAPREEAT
ncbi:MAG: hypothetical protein A2284_15190 [Deltaproteobacteria bacterium RIFOXYA12_FULL_61_11]|nr:MAG: hypothetical protein A2284_15190 [Deltaproteobacteria bacterium RIFOXYA12_FULL_61_11]